jgi:hypothetical protein
MSRVKIKQSLFRLSKWVAFILGIGALFAGEPRADESRIQPVGAMGPTNRFGLNADEVLIRIEGEQIYISQDGSLFKELSLVSAPASTYFKDLLRDATTTGGQITVPIGPMIVASGGSGTNGAKSKEADKKKMEQKDTPTNKPPVGK